MPALAWPPVPDWQAEPGYRRLGRGGLWQAARQSFGAHLEGLAMLRAMIPVGFSVMARPARGNRRRNIGGGLKRRGGHGWGGRKCLRMGFQRLCLTRISLTRVSLMWAGQMWVGWTGFCNRRFVERAALTRRINRDNRTDRRRYGGFVPQDRVF